MAAHFLLTLDTTAPTATFGTPEGAETGQLLVVPYTVDEPALVDARFRTAAGELVAMTVHPDRVEGFIEPTYSGGMGRLTVTLRDDLGNERDQDEYVSIEGVVTAQPSAPRSGPGITPTARSRRPGRRVLVPAVSQVRVRSRGSIAHASISHSRAESVSRVAGRAQLQARSRAPGHQGAQVAGTSISAKVATAVTASATVRRARRRESDDVAAFLLDLW